MSALLALDVCGDPIERVEADVAIVGCMSDERPLRGAAARADWRLCGALSRLLAEGDLEAVPGEAALLPGGGGVRAPRLLALGLGALDRARAERLDAYAGGALERLVGLRVSRPALALLPPEHGEAGDQVEALVAGLAQRLGEVRPDAEVCLRLVVPGDELASARRTLAELATRSWPEGLGFSAAS